MAVFPRGKTADDMARRKIAAINEIIKTLDDGERVTYVDMGPKLIEPSSEIAPDMVPNFLHPTA